MPMMDMNSFEADPHGFQIDFRTPLENLEIFNKFFPLKQNRQLTGGL